MPEENFSPQTINQKKMAFAASDHVAIVITLLQECGGVDKLVGDTEFATVINASTLDAQQNMIARFISMIDSIKKGVLHEPK